MGRSRYARNQIINGRHYATWRDPIAENFLGPDIMDGVPALEYTVQVGDRLDSLARKYYGDVELWWVIALANRIMFALSLTPGRKLLIPKDARMIIDKVQR